MLLQEASENIGRKVIYTPYQDCDIKAIEYGVITSVNNNFVFVRYGKDVNSKATRAENLEFDR